MTNYLACAGGDATHDNLGPGGMDRSNGMFRAALFKRTSAASDAYAGRGRWHSAHADGQ